MSGLALAFPISATFILVQLVAFGLLVDGIARIAHGIGEKSDSKFNRFFSIGVGIISIVLAIYIIASPLFGFAFVGFLIGISIFITGIQILVAGLRGRKLGLEPTTTHLEK